MRLVLITACLLSWAALASAAQPAHLLTEKQAEVKAVDLLLGEPYGKNAAAVRANLYERALLKEGHTLCNDITLKHPVWSFHVVVNAPASDKQSEMNIDGYVDVDAVTGKIWCAAPLPFLD